MIDVVVAVVLHDSEALVPGLAESLGDGLEGVTSWHLVVADSGSRDGGPEAVRTAFPEATVISLGANLGYGAGLNAAVRAAPPHRAVLVMNPDVRLGPGSVAALLDRASEGDAATGSAQIGIVVPRLLDGAGVPAPSIRRRPTVGRAAGEAFLGGRLAGRWGALGEVVTDPSAYTCPGPVDWATGAVWLVTADCFRSLRGFDPSYFLYSEETDFALRARDAGYRTWYEPAAVATHIGGSSNVDPSLYALLTWNRFACYRRHHGAAASLAFRGALLAGEVTRGLAGRSTARAAAAALVSGRPSLLTAAAPVERAVRTADGVHPLTSEPDLAAGAGCHAAGVQPGPTSGDP
jgi:N-acetylglucosaminyl-diphospho-decaprenol L-rhamnosyltransferase